MAVEPAVLEGAFAALLGNGDRADVVQFHGATAEELSTHYDAAVVTDGLAEGVRPDVLITLPDTERGGRVARVTIGDISRCVDVGKNGDVIDLLSEQFGTELPSSAQSEIS